MAQIILVKVLIIIVLSGHVFAVSHSNNRRKGRIVNGELAYLNEFPYQAAILRFDGTPDCGGSIIHKNFILTASHCYRNFYSHQKIVVGDYDYSSYSAVNTRQERWVTEFIQHPYYDSFSSANDIALIYVRQPFKLIPGVVEKVKLATNSTYPFGKVTISGWGRTNLYDGTGNKNIPHYLQKATFQILPKAKCKNIWRLPETMHEFCFKHPKSFTNVCYGDSGGALVQYDRYGKAEQIGVLSYGTKSCATHKPAVSVLVSYYLEWIKQTMAEIQRKHLG